MPLKQLSVRPRANEQCTANWWQLYCYIRQGLFAKLAFPTQAFNLVSLSVSPEQGWVWVSFERFCFTGERKEHLVLRSCNRKRCSSMCLTNSGPSPFLGTPLVLSILLETTQRQRYYKAQFVFCKKRSRTFRNVPGSLGPGQLSKEECTALTEENPNSWSNDLRSLSSSFSSVYLLWRYLTCTFIAAIWLMAIFLLLFSRKARWWEDHCKRTTKPNKSKQHTTHLSWDFPHWSSMLLFWICRHGAILPRPVRVPWPERWVRTRGSGTVTLHTEKTYRTHLVCGVALN